MRKFSGILKGCDYDEWDPETYLHLPANFRSADLAGKKQCKLELQRLFGFPESASVPLIGMVSRLTMQKGFDYLMPAISEILGLKLQVIVLGSGGTMDCKHF